jgi:hypothetical protein
MLNGFLVIIISGESEEEKHHDKEEDEKAAKGEQLRDTREKENLCVRSVIDVKERELRQLAQ